MVQLSHLYMTTWKTIALTIWTFVSKVSLCFLMCHLYLSQCPRVHSLKYLIDNAKLSFKKLNNYSPIASFPIICNSSSKCWFLFPFFTLFLLAYVCVCYVWCVYFSYWCVETFYIFRMYYQINIYQIFSPFLLLNLNIIFIEFFIKYHQKFYWGGF